MKRILFSLFMVSIFACSSFAQLPVKIGVEANVGVPMGNFSDYANTGFGGNAFVELTSYNASLGYISFSGKDLGGGVKTTISGVPVLVGVKYNFIPLFFGFIQAGVCFNSVKAETSSMGISYSATASETDFAYAAGVGVSLLSWDVKVKYSTMGYTNSDFVSIGLAYHFL